MARAFCSLQLPVWLTLLHHVGLFGQLWGSDLAGVLAQAPAQSAPAVATAQNGQAVHAYVAQSNHGTWLFPPHQGGGQNG
jgi:hypothetical protein